MVKVELREMKELAGTSGRQQVVVSTERHNTPVLNVDDLFDVYKTAVQCWEKAVKDTVPKKKRAGAMLYGQSSHDATVVR